MMGEYAEMMLDGTLDAVTGEYLGLDTGYPISNDPDWIGNKPHKKKKQLTEAQRKKRNQKNKLRKQRKKERERLAKEPTK